MAHRLLSTAAKLERHVLCGVKNGRLNTAQVSGPTSDRFMSVVTMMQHDVVYAKPCKWIQI